MTDDYGQTDNRGDRLRARAVFGPRPTVRSPVHRPSRKPLPRKGYGRSRTLRTIGGVRPRKAHVRVRRRERADVRPYRLRGGGVWRLCLGLGLSWGGWVDD